jgi:uncharacterized protein with PIN domain
MIDIPLDPHNNFLIKAKEMTMVRVLQQGKAQPVSRVSCNSCNATLEVSDREWRDSGYGSERHVSCPNCGSYVAKPGSEYTGDF